MERPIYGVGKTVDLFSYIFPANFAIKVKNKQYFMGTPWPPGTACHFLLFCHT
jgi:hypothetical protein